jgi:hypothetical protein
MTAFWGERKIQIARIPRWKPFLPDFHNCARARQVGGRSSRLGKVREISAPIRTSIAVSFQVAQKSGMALWTGCTRLKTGKIELRKIP